jgi:S-adenosylmethionine synthetase
MNRRGFLSLAARTAALTVTATPVLGVSGEEVARHGGIAPRRVTSAEDYVVSAESFCEGHPDKLADLIADQIVDDYQNQTPGRPFEARFEVFASSALICVGGNVVGAWVGLDEEEQIRHLLGDTAYFDGGFTVDPYEIEIRLQFNIMSGDITRGWGGEPGPDEQALVYGYASDETPELMPMPTLYAHRLTQRIAEVRRAADLPWLLPHGQTKVSVRYALGEPVAIDDVEVMVQHLPEADQRFLEDTIIEEVVFPTLPEGLLHKGTRFFINATGANTYEGLITRSGVSGRTLASDTYGAHCPLPAGGLSGQGSESIRRMGTLMARYLAKHVVASQLARRCTVHLAYQAGVPDPQGVLVDTHGTGAVAEERIERAIREVFPLTPYGIFRHLDLGRPLYRKAAAFGYFGRDEPEFTWERLDQLDDLNGAV